ncbi:MAG TPA: ATP-binding protein [Candidatus Limnocylindrales bacterium]|nr:ATP-binding protein [Candidatus Limnocylindrales bacterium]
MRALLLFLRRRIALKLTLTLVGFVAIAMLAAGFYLDHALGAFAVESLEARLAAVGRVLHDEARAVRAPDVPPAEAHAFVMRAARAADARVTLIAPDGRVVAESERPFGDLPAIENHRDRPEVRAALAGRVGRDLQRSATVDVRRLYVALPVTDGGRVVGVLRLTLPLGRVTGSYETLHRVMLAGGVVALAVALGIGLFVSGRVTRPVVEMQSIARQMSEGNFAVRAPVRSPDEIGTLGRSLNVLAARLREKIQDLAREQAKATAILDAMVEGVIAVDGHDRILLMNERARVMFGLAARRGEGQPFLEAIRSPDLHEAMRACREAEAGTVTRREVRLSAPAERVVQVHVAPLGGPLESAGVVMVLHDVTALRRLEHMRTEFIANVSHELRTPLTAIHGYLETLLGGALEEPEHARPFLDIVFRHTERLGRLLNDLTDLSDIELGRVTLALGPVDLGEAVESVLAIIRPKADRGGVSLDVKLGSDVPAVRADRDRLVQILINLVDNAVKYTPSGGRVTVSASTLADGLVEVTVADTGTGIPAADLPRITERFYRVDRARSRELGGTGLGLAIVKHLVQGHGGELQLASTLGEGTAVTFTIPSETGT